MSTRKGLGESSAVANTIVMWQETHLRLSGESRMSCWKKEKGKLHPLSLYHEAEVNLVLPLSESSRFGLQLGVREGTTGQNHDGNDGHGGKG